ncbi:MAG: hypothetical protein KF774_06030 [Planctomyces sp.]|nr:hypothetical protein [Planctomyces sp.]
MSDVTALVDRIDAEFSEAQKSIESFRDQELAAYQGREQRLEQFHAVCESLQGVWRPRIDALAKKFGEKAKVSPKITPAERAADFEFTSPLAQIHLRFSATTDYDVRNLVLNYQLDVLPILMKFNPHAQVEFPLDAVDPDAVAKWLDDRIVDFVKTYLALHRNEYYLKGKTVTDPISNTQFPKYAAAATLDWQGRTYYFISPVTLRQFQEQKGLPVS